MQELLELLKFWNGGIERGAQAKLSKVLGESTGNISSWVSSRLKPSEKSIKRMAELFSKSDEVKQAGIDVSEEGLKKMFGIKSRAEKQLVGFELLPRQAVDNIRTISAMYHADEVVFLDDIGIALRKEQPMLINLKITENIEKLKLEKGDSVEVDSRNQGKQGEVCMFCAGDKYNIGWIAGEYIIGLGNGAGKIPLKEIKVIGVATKFTRSLTSLNME